MSENEFILKLKEIGIELSENQKKLFSDYADTLLEYNRHTNLTAIRTKDEVYLKHFLDSIMAFKFYNFSGKRVLDIGCGAGFPGVPLKIIDDSISLTLLDSNGKKTKFLSELKSVLNLEFDVINDRAEKYILNRREYYDIVTSRAVASLPVLSELALPFLKVNGCFLAYKGDIDENIEGADYAIDILGGKLVKIERFLLPIENAKRSILIIEKKCKTSCEYPRVFDKITKKPLQKTTK